MEKELGRMQLELESEYDVEREKNLREQLKTSCLKIAELHEKIEEHVRINFNFVKFILLILFL